MKSIFRPLKIKELKSKIFEQFISIPPKSTERLLCTGASGGAINGKSSMKLQDRYDKSRGYIVSPTNTLTYGYVGSRGNVTCPVLPFSTIEELKSIVSGEIKECEVGIKRGKIDVLSGKPASEEVQKDLVNAIQNGLQPIDGLTFPTDSQRCDDFLSPLQIKNNSYYEYDGTLYSVLTVNSMSGRVQINGKTYNDGDQIAYPVVEGWLYIDEKHGIAVPAESIFDEYGFAEGFNFAGVPFSHTQEYPDDFDASDIGKYCRAFTEFFFKLQQMKREREAKKEGRMESEKRNGGAIEEQEGEIASEGTTVTDDNKRKYIESINELLQTLDVNNKEIARLQKLIDNLTRQNETIREVINNLNTLFGDDKGKHVRGGREDE